MSTLPLDTPAPSVGSLLSETFATVRGRFGPIVGIAVVAAVPIVIAAGAVQETSESAALTRGPGAFVGSMLVFFLTLSLMQAATAGVAFAVFQFKRGREVGFGECANVVVGKLGPVLAVSLLAGILTVLGYILCIVPGIYASLALAVAVPVTVIESLGVTASLRRSRDLSRGYLGIIFGTLFVFALLQLPFSIPASLVATRQPVVGLILNGIAYVISISLSSSFYAVLYYRLRLVKEGVDVEHLAAVFE